jgi:hypothetical protein
MEQCTESPVDILEVEGRFLAVCTPCRLAMGAMTIEEKRENARRFNAAQVALFKS